VDRLASELGRHSAFVLKRRMGDGTFLAFGLSGEVKGRKVVLCDDMIRTGGTLINAARACLDAGATSVSAVAIHGAFSPRGIADLRDSGLFDYLLCTDSHPNSSQGEKEWPELFCCAGVLAEALAANPSGVPEYLEELRR
jgi:ribose-phosphate pyrophosphokinase